MTPLPANTDTTDAWAFVLRHTDMMERLAHRFGPKNVSDRDEWLRDVFVRIVEKHAAYDSSKSAPQTWIVWQMRAVLTTWNRRFKKRCREGYGNHEAMVLIPLRPEQHGSAEHSLTTERHDDLDAVVSTLYSLSTPEEQVAIRTFLAGMPATQLRKRHGMSGVERTNHLQALCATLKEIQ